MPCENWSSQRRRDMRGMRIGTESLFWFFFVKYIKIVTVINVICEWKLAVSTNKLFLSIYLPFSLLLSYLLSFLSLYIFLSVSFLPLCRRSLLWNLKWLWEYLCLSQHSLYREISWHGAQEAHRQPGSQYTCLHTLLESKFRWAQRLSLLNVFLYWFAIFSPTEIFRSFLSIRYRRITGRHLKNW